MKRILALGMLVAAACASKPAPAGVAAMVADGEATVERFFGAPFPRRPKVMVAPDRKTFDASFPAEWGMGPTQCWMVGVGVADFLAILDPQAWTTDACDHTGAPAEVREIITHELTHSFHGQHNPSPDFSEAEEMGWFIEGLAVLVSREGQDLAAASAEAVRARGGPQKLADVWSGRDRYVNAGSLVRYVDATWGRAMTRRLMGVTRTDDALAALGVSETELLARWRRWLGVT